MRKRNLIFIVCIVELAVIGAAALVFSEVARKHPVAFILAAILVVVTALTMGLLDQHYKEQQIIRTKEHELEKSRMVMQMDLALRGINGGFVIQKDDEEKTFVHVSESLAALLGYTVEEFLAASNNKTSGIVPEEDFKSMFTQFQDEKQTLRFHARCKDGSLRWISSKGKIIINEEGERLRYSFNHDITELEEKAAEIKQTSAILRQERQMYRDAMLHGCEYAYVVNVNENRLEDVYKGGFLEKYGFGKNMPYDEAMAEVVKMMRPVILHEMEEFHLTSHYRKAYEQGKRMVEVEYYIPDEGKYKRKSIFLSKDENDVMHAFVVNHDITMRRWEELEMEKSLTQLAEAAKLVGRGNLDVEIDGNAPGLVGVLAIVLQQTITHLKQSIDQLNQQAVVDALTGLKNKRAWQERVALLEEEIRLDRAEFAIVVCDINGLKVVNDTLGHEAGDRLIVRAGNLISRAFQYSTVYRIGGDEFAVVLEGRDLEERDSCLQELQNRLANQSSKEGTDNPVSIAVGISLYQKGDTDSTQVFRRADENMYENKMKMKQKIKTTGIISL